MNSIFKTYNSLVQKFHEIEKDSTPDEIHDKRVILRRVFPILTAFGISHSKVKNGGITFKLFGKLRDIQVQIEKLGKAELTPSLIEYLEFLKTKELKLREKVRKFSKKEKLKFPVIKKKLKVNSKKIKIRANKLLISLTAKIQSLVNGNAIEIHLIRIDFKKYRYMVEVLDYIEVIDEKKLDEMKHYQDVLGQIHDFEVFFNAAGKYYRKRKLVEDEDLAVFKKEQIILEENFKNEAKEFIGICKSVLGKNDPIHSLNSQANSKTGKEILLNEPEKEIEKKEVKSPPVSTKNKPKNISDEFVVGKKVIDAVLTKPHIKEKPKKLMKNVVVNSEADSSKNPKDSPILNRI
ncbi:MAG: CHAD domain-containing protein [Bacteroidota bacterium]